MGEYKLCRLCKEVETQTVFNIRFKAIPICHSCSTTIFLQEAQWLGKRPKPKEIKERKVKGKKIE